MSRDYVSKNILEVSETLKFLDGMKPRIFMDFRQQWDQKETKNSRWSLPKRWAHGASHEIYLKPFP